MSSRVQITLGMVVSDDSEADPADVVSEVEAVLNGLSLDGKLRIEPGTVEVDDWEELS